MSKHRQITEGQPIPQDWMDSVQEFLGSLMSADFVVQVVNPTTLRVPASPGNGQVAISINGKWRWISANADAAAPGGLAAGDHPIFVAASDNSFAPNSSPPPRESDSTDYNFRLIVKPVGSTPSGTGAEAIWRQIGTATWSGSAFTDVRLNTTSLSALAKHAATHAPGASDAIDYTLVHMVGTLAARPVPAAVNNGLLYLATDVNGGTLYRSDAITWTAVSGPTAKYMQTIGDGSSTTFNVVHNFGTTDVVVQVREMNAPFSVVHPEIQIIDVNTTRVIFDAAPPANTYRVIVVSPGTQVTTVLSIGAYGPVSIGDGVATSFVVAHNLGIQDVAVLVRAAGAPYGEVDAEVEHTDVNSVTIRFAAPPALNAYVVKVFSSIAGSASGAASVHASQHAPGGVDAINYTLVNLIGLDSAKPAAAPANAGLLYFATDTKAVYRSTGAAWAAVTGGVPFVTLAAFNALTPADGMEVYVQADAANGINWHLRYNGASGSAYKWEFLGGPWLTASVATLESVSSATSYLDLATVGPSITTPRGGDYTVEIQFHLPNNQTNIVMSFAVGGTAASDADSAGGIAANSGYPSSAGFKVRKTGVAASAAVTAKYKSADVVRSFQDRWMFLRPVRVS